MREAHDCDDLDDLLDVARTANADCVPPLPDSEVVKLSRSAWEYTERGQNLVGRQHVRISFEVIDHLFAIDLDAYVLLTLLLRHHADRRRFFVANAMAESMPPDGWALKRFRSARARTPRRTGSSCACAMPAAYMAPPSMAGDRRDANEETIDRGRTLWIA